MLPTRSLNIVLYTYGWVTTPPSRIHLTARVMFEIRTRLIVLCCSKFFKDVHHSQSLVWSLDFVSTHSSILTSVTSFLHWTLSCIDLLLTSWIHQFHYCLGLAHLLIPLLNALAPDLCMTYPQRSGICFSVFPSTGFLLMTLSGFVLLQFRHFDILCHISVFLFFITLITMWNYIVYTRIYFCCLRFIWGFKGRIRCVNCCCFSVT